MQVGDLVRVQWKEAGLYSTAIIISGERCASGFFTILCDGERRIMHSDFMKVVSPALSDEQLENVVGGMSPERFSQWRAEKLNEDR